MAPDYRIGCPNRGLIAEPLTLGVLPQRGLTRRRERRRLGLPSPAGEGGATAPDEGIAVRM